MATLYVSEFTHLGFDGSSSPVLAPAVPATIEQPPISIGGVSQQGIAFSLTTRFILINTDTACCVAFGSNPIAVTTAHRMGANETRFYTVKPGDTIAVILGT